jgi:hypothetical protein
MVKELRIYFEGDDDLRPGFGKFLKEIKEAAHRKRWEFAVVATNGTPAKEYLIALQTHRRAWNVLLLDSDEAVGSSLVKLLRKKGLEGCDPKRVFWMVQVMESWFLADIDALKRFYHDGFRESALKGNPRVEEIPKVDVLSRLKKATSGTKSGKYQKSHAFRLIEMIDPALVRKAAPSCERMFRVLLAKLR